MLQVCTDWMPSCHPTSSVGRKSTDTSGKNNHPLASSFLHSTDRLLLKECYSLYISFAMPVPW